MMLNMNHQTTHPNRCALVTELIGALIDVDALEQLSHSRLAALASLMESELGTIGDFGIRCRIAWDLARPPTHADLIELADFPTGIDWDDDDETNAVWAPVVLADQLGDRETGEGTEADTAALTVALAEVDRLPRKVAA